MVDEFGDVGSGGESWIRFFPTLATRSMLSTTGSVGGSRARVIYHTPGKSFAWLHKGLRNAFISGNTRAG